MKGFIKKEKQDTELEVQDKLVNVAKESKAVKKKPKPKKLKATKIAGDNAVAVEIKESAKNLSPADIAKIEKKKAKKLAQKLKKQQKKSETTTNEIRIKVEPKSPEKTTKKNKSSPAGAEIKNETPTQTKTSVGSIKKEKKNTKSKRNNKDTGRCISKPTFHRKYFIVITILDEVKRERDPEAEKATVFVGNVPVNTKRVQLVRLFQPYGTVNFIRLRTAGGKNLFKHKQRKGAGSLNAYVVLNSVEAAQKALALNGTEFKEHHLRVTPSAKGVGGLSVEAETDVKRTIFVGNLKYCEWLRISNELPYI